MGEIFKKFWRLKEEYFVFWASLIFYLSLYFNLNNKTLLFFFAVFLGVLFLKFQDLKQTFFWGFIASLPLIVGKTYFYELIPASELYTPDNPEGYFLKLVITPTNIIAIFMVPILVRSLVAIWEKRRIVFDFCLLSLVLLVIFVFFSTLNSKNPLISFFYFLKFLQLPLVFLYARYLLDWSQKTRRIFVFLLLSLVIFESFWVFLQFVKGGPLGHSIESYQGIVPFGRGVDEDVWRYRPTGTFDHANFVAAFLLPIIILIFSAFYSRFQTMNKDYGYFFSSFALGFVTIAVTLSRSAWISLVASLVILTYILEKKYHLVIGEIYKKRLLMLVSFLLVITPIFILPRVVSTFNTFVSGGSLVTRWELMRESLEVIRQNLFLGVGFGMSVPEMFANNPGGIMYVFPTPVHNWYLLFASEAGVLALLAFLFLLNSCFSKVIPQKGEKVFLAGAFVACLAMLLNGMFQPFIGDRELLFVFLGIFAAQSSKK